MLQSMHYLDHAGAAVPSTTQVRRCDRQRPRAQFCCSDGCGPRYPLWPAAGEPAQRRQPRWPRRCGDTRCGGGDARCARVRVHAC